MNLIYLLIGIVCGAVGIIMLLAALSSSPFKKKADHPQNHDYPYRRQPPRDGGPYGY